MRWNKAIILLVSLMIMLSLTVMVFAKDPANKEKNVSKTLVPDAKLLDINQIEAWVSNDGGFGQNPATGGDGFYFPKGQRRLSRTAHPGDHGDVVEGNLQVQILKIMLSGPFDEDGSVLHGFWVSFEGSSPD